MWTNWLCGMDEQEVGEVFILLDVANIPAKKVR